MSHDVIDLASRLELMVDNHLVDELTGPVHRRLHTPTPQEIVLTTDQPWEGSMCNMATVLRDPWTQKYRLYYRAGDYSHLTNNNVVRLMEICLAESDDGITWQRRLTMDNPHEGQPTNIILKGDLPHSAGTVGFAPFFDRNSKAKRVECYKAISSDENRPPSGLFMLTSYDGYHWTRQSDTPFFTESLCQRMRFDSLNTLFWDPNINQYRLYYRDYDADNIRCIRMSTSEDLVNWSPAIWLDYGQDAPHVHLYTNNIQPYYRAPHLLLGFPARYTQREWSPTIEALPELEHRQLRAAHAVGVRCGSALTEGLFMSSRDGQHFDRWDEAFFRPGQTDEGNWAYGDNFPANGMIQTTNRDFAGRPELSFYLIENYWRQTRIRRHTLRVDGFVSLQGAYRGGAVTTKPFTFTGSRLTLNIATSAAGSARVEILNAQGQPIPGYTLDDCHDIVGDTLAYTVRWKEGPGVDKLQRQPIRLRITLHDANLYALQFHD